MLRVVALLSAIAALASARAMSAQTPHVVGTVVVDPPRGMLAADLCLSRLPPGDTVRFLLHRGLSIARIRDSAGRSLNYDGFYDGRMVGEGVEYMVADTLPEPRELCISYTGAFPVYAVEDSAYNVFDYKGWIAFNGKTLRATEQSKWYPVPYDAAAGRSYARMSYRLRVRCPECASIYVNGAPPGRGPELEAVSERPNAPLLFAGDFAFEEVGGTLFLNSDISDEAAAVLSARVADIKRFYEAFLAVPYGDTVVFLEHRPVEYYRPGRSWGFVTWPTVAFAGTRISDFVADGELADWVWRFLAHEMGHFYFGTVVEPRGPYRWFFLESVPEYLALRVVQRFAGEKSYRETIAGYYEQVAADTALPQLDRISQPDAIGERYRYRYGPLLLVMLEREAGAERMGRVLNALLRTPASVELDYAYLARAAREAGIGEAVWQRFEDQCVRRPPAASCLSGLAR